MRICKKCFREIGEYPFCPYCGASQKSNLLTLEQIYTEWSMLYFRKVGRKSREGYENAWRTLRFLGQSAMSDIKISDYQLAMDTLQNKSRSLQNKLLLLIGQLCKYAVTVHRLDVINGITEKVKVVEKKSRTAQMLRVLINAVFVVVRCAALIAIAGLAIIGLATLIYPNMRAAALETWQEIVIQLADFLCK